MFLENACKGYKNLGLLDLLCKISMNLTKPVSRLLVYVLRIMGILQYHCSPSQLGFSYRALD